MKDFSNVNTNPVFANIAAATEEEQQIVTEPRKERKVYTQAEAKQYVKEFRTQGRKGCKMKRINLAFSDENYDYIETMANAQGLTLTAFCNLVIHYSMQNNKEIYEQAKEMKKAFDLNNAE